MSAIDCAACNDLRDTAPDFVANGVTNIVAASLKNNTGLNPALTVLHDNCTDLQAVNDCLIGRLSGELEAYDVCDWKDFMKKFLPNLYETLKADIMWLCGLQTFSERICATAQQALVGSIPIIANRTASGGAPFGIIATKNGVPIIRPYTRAEWGHDPSYGPGVGIRYKCIEAADCETQARKRVQQFNPYVYQYKANTTIEPGDVLWYVKHDELIDNIGATCGEEFWRKWFYTDGTGASWTWNGQGYMFANTMVSVMLRMGKAPDGEDALQFVYVNAPQPNRGLTLADGDVLFGWTDGNYKTWQFG